MKYKKYSLFREKRGFFYAFIFIISLYYGTTNKYIDRLTEDGIYLHKSILDTLGISGEIVELTERQVLLLLSLQGPIYDDTVPRHIYNNEHCPIILKGRQKQQKWEQWILDVFYREYKEECHHF